MAESIVVNITAPAPQSLALVFPPIAAELFAPAWQGALAASSAQIYPILDGGGGIIGYAISLQSPGTGQHGTATLAVKNGQSGTLTLSSSSSSGSTVTLAADHVDSPRTAQLPNASGNLACCVSIYGQIVVSDINGLGSLATQNGTFSLAGLGAAPAAGSTSIVTLGTIASGTWNGTTIALANGGTGASSAAGAVTNLVGIVTEATTARTLADADSGTIILCTSSSATTLSVPSTLAARFNVLIIQGGSGKVTIANPGGSTLQSYGGALKLSGQHASATIIRVAAATYNVSGNLTV
ncbi:MAG: hypothetical protein WCK77_25130 [Verrucomicrobiota bacterium]